MKPAVVAVVRFVRSLTRPSTTANAKLFRQRGESAASFLIRDAVRADIPALARLHVTTWNATYPGVRRKPTYELREHQWREAFEEADGSWFCLVIERRNGGDLIGFAKGQRYRGDLPGFAGELNKLYLRRDYQRLGFGRQLTGHVARRFLSQEISTMVLFADPQNPSCYFFEALGGERLVDANGEFHGGYGWRDLKTLDALSRRARRPIEA